MVEHSPFHAFRFFPCLAMPCRASPGRALPRCTMPRLPCHCDLIPVR